MLILPGFEIRLIKYGNNTSETPVFLEGLEFQDVFGYLD